MDHSVPADPNNLIEMYKRSLAANPGAIEAATIPVEKVNGPILLLSGSDDRMWPAPQMADSIIARLKQKGFAHGFEQVIYPDAGHTLSEGYMIGGTAEGNKLAHEKSDAKMVEFLGKVESQLGGHH